MSSRRSTVRYAALFTVVGLTLAGCGAASKPGVSVAQLEANVRFGSTAEPTPAGDGGTQPSTVVTQPTTTTVMVPGLPGSSQPTSDAPPPFAFPTEGAPSILTPVYPSEPGTGSVCPEPPIGSSPAKVVTYPTQGQPAPGYYLYQQVTGKVIAGVGDVFDTSHLVNVQVLKPSAITTTNNPTASSKPQTKFTYDEIIPQSNGDTITYTFSVVNNAIDQQTQNVEGNTPPIIVGVDDGISIASEVEKDKTGKTLFTFKPATPVTIAPLPIQVGGMFASSGTDAASGQSLTISGTIKTTDRIVGCGEFIQGWQISATEIGKAAGPDGTVSTITGTATYDVAPQYGGLLVSTLFTPQGSTVVSGGEQGSITPSQKPNKTS